MELAISQPKRVRLPRNKKQTHRLNSRLQIGPSGLTLAMTLTLNFQGQIWNWLYLCQKWSDCHETKSEHIDWTLGLKCDHQIWHWPWPWPWIFKVKYEICYISTKSGPIATRWKANISIWILGLKFDNGFDLGHDLDIWIFKVICDLDHLVTKVRCKDLPDSDRGDFSCRRAVNSSIFVYANSWVYLIPYLFVWFNSLFHGLCRCKFECGSGHRTEAVLLPGFAINW